jgi:peptidoglycan/xylan/chitin deacetylase (PgdA/CDA1 family)
MKLLSIFWHTVKGDLIPPAYRGGNPTVALFKAQMEFLTKNYTPISVAEFLRIRRDKRLRERYAKPPVLLGFDDGFKNVISNALPVLQKFAAPAVFFVIAKVIEDPMFVPWYVEVRHLVRRTQKKVIKYGDTSIDLSLPQGPATLKRLFAACFIGSKSEAERERLLMDFAKLLSVARPTGNDLDEDLKLINVEDVVNLKSSSLLTVASHGMTHRDLRALPYEEQYYELVQSDLLLRQHCPVYYPVIAYPSGAFNKITLSISTRIYEAGFGSFVGASYGNPYAYPRIGLGFDSVQEVAYAVSCKRLNYILPLKRFLDGIGVLRIVQ